MAVRMSSLKMFVTGNIRRHSGVQLDTVPSVGPPLAAACPLTDTLATCSTAAAAIISIQMQATGGTPPYTWALLAGPLPVALTLNADGTITGQVGNIGAGDFPFQAQVTDVAGNSVVLDCVLHTELCADTTAAHPIVQHFPNPGFDSADFFYFEPFQLGVPNCAALRADCVAKLFTSGPDLATYRPAPLGSLPAILPNCPEIPPPNRIAMMLTTFPVSMNQDASIVVGLNPDVPAGGLGNGDLAACVRMRKINPAGTNKTNNLFCLGFSFRKSLPGNVPTVTLYRNTGGQVSLAVPGLVDGDVLTVSARCNTLFGSINGVQVLQLNNILCSAGQPGIFNRDFADTACLTQSIHDWSADLRV